MSSNFTFFITEHDISSLDKISKGNLSFVIRHYLEDYNLDEVKDRVCTKRKGFRIEDNIREKLEKDAAELGVSTSALVRAIIESRLETETLLKH